MKRVLRGKRGIAAAVCALASVLLISGVVVAQAQQAAPAKPDYEAALKNLRFRSIGPAIMGGRVDDFAVVESNPSTVYVAMASGGVWKTVNAGTTWEPLFDDQAVSTIGDVTVALLSLERYRDFSRLRYLAHTSDPAHRAPLAALDVLVVDERGRRYRTASIGVDSAGNRLEGVIALAPGIPRETTSLTVTIGTLGERGPEGILGPWVFPIRLPTPFPG